MLCLTVFLLLSCKQKKTCDVAPLKVIEKQGVTIPVYDFKTLQPLLVNNECDDLHVINFWATWCKPCVAELPYFEQLHKEKGVKVTLISLDLPSLVDSKLIPFIKERKLASDVVLLDDPDANAWISLVDKDWSGAIPATLILKNKKQKFYEQSFTYKSLEEAIKNL